MSIKIDYKKGAGARSKEQGARSKGQGARSKEQGVWKQGNLEANKQRSKKEGN